MHITIDTQAFKEILEIAAKVSTKHITLPILQAVLLTVTKEGLEVRATNLEIGVCGVLSGEVIEEGCVAVPAPTLLYTVSLVTQKTITMTTEGDVLHIETHSSKTDIKTMGASEFPLIPEIAAEPQKINGALFALGIKTTAFTASQTSIRPELGSIYVFQKKEHSLTFVATDSFRLMEKTVPCKGVTLTESILIPYKNALELARVAELHPDDVTLAINENQCALRAGNLYITSRLVSGTFPDYERIIPKEFKTTAVLLVSDLALALKKTNIFLNKFMQLTLTLSESGITLSSQSGEFGATTESIPGSVTGDELRLNFNQRYIQDGIAHFTDDSVRIKFEGIGRSMVMENVHDVSLRYIVMPMNK